MNMQNMEFDYPDFFNMYEALAFGYILSIPRMVSIKSASIYNTQYLFNSTN